MKAENKFNLKEVREREREGEKNMETSSKINLKVKTKTKAAHKWQSLARISSTYSTKCPKRRAFLCTLFLLSLNLKQHTKFFN